MTTMTAQGWINAAIENDREALIDGIKTIYNCREVEVTDDGRIRIAQPQRSHWLGEDEIERVGRALRAGDI
jgi:hypothetical protein